MKQVLLLFAPLAVLWLLGGCLESIRRNMDTRVYQVIEQRQKDAIGSTTDVSVRYPKNNRPGADQMYSLTPSPLATELPNAFQDAAPSSHKPEQADSTPAPDVSGSDEGHEREETGGTDTAETEGEQTTPSTEIFTREERASLKVFGLRDALVYAMKHGRDLQNAKEDLYLAALDLTLERHLWTPQFASTIRAEFADFGQVRDFDRAMTAVADASLSQRLPYGGEVSARIVGSLMRDLGRHITSGETGQAILQANIPLFRGAGKVAYESRFVAERELIYAVRIYERFRREYIVRIAGSFFALQGTKAGVYNAFASYESNYQSWEKADAKKRLHRAEKIEDATRALSNLRRAESTLVERKERFASALDQFKILIGMAVIEPLDVLPQEDDPAALQVESLLSDVSEETAVHTALKYRLEVLTSADRVDDTRRGVVIAKNRILPDLDFNGSVATASDPNRKSALSFNTERATWRASLDWQLDDRMTERTGYRQALVTQRRAERRHEELEDLVRADVRSALRRIAREDAVRAIETASVEENVFRAEAARAQFDLGKATNQNVIDADDDVLAARDSLAAAIANHRNAILRFRLDTGTLRVTDDGRWGSGSTPAAQTTP